MAYQTAFWFALPMLAACSLFVPKAVRNEFTPLAASGGPSPDKVGADPGPLGASIHIDSVST